MLSKRLLLISIPAVVACSLVSRIPGGSVREVGSAPLVITSTGVPPTVTTSPLPPTETPTPSPKATATATAPPSETPTIAPSFKFTQTVVAETRGLVTVQTTTITRHYTISGYSQMDLEAQMRSLGPTDAASGSHWYALTEPGFDWDYQPVCTESGCTTGPVLILFSLRYTLPEWISADGADQALRDQWQAFSGAVSLHEHGHGERAAACAWRLGEAFAALPPAASADDLDWSLRVAGDAVFAICRDEQSGYEYETDHGRTQGVVWGP